MVVQQPQFMAWVGYWAKVRAAQRLVMYAGVKFDKSDHQHRVTLDDDLWVGMQVGDSERNKLIKDVQVSDHMSLRKLAKTLVQKFPRSRYPYVERLAPIIETLEQWSGKWMLDLNLDVQQILCNQLHVTAETWVDLRDRSPMEKIAKLQDTVNAWGQRKAEYYMGAGGLDYMGYDSLPGTTIYVQRQARDVSPHSIVGLLASTQYPEKIVDESYVWVDKNENRHWILNGVRVEDHS